MRRLVVVRHGESESNDGRATATTLAQRRPFVEAYWGAADPQHRDQGVESFSDFFKLAKTFGQRAAMADCSLNLVLTHGLFATLFDYQCSNPQGQVDGDPMRKFDQLRRSPMGNGKALEYCLTATGRLRTVDGSAFSRSRAYNRE